MDVDAEVAEFLSVLGCSDYIDVTFYAHPGVYIKVHLEKGHSFVNFAGSDCTVSPRRLIGRIRELVRTKVWNKKGTYAELYGWPYGEKDDVYREMVAECRCLAKFHKPPLLELERVIRWVKCFELEYFILRGNRLFIYFNSWKMMIDFEHREHMHALGVIEEGDPAEFI